MTVEQVDRDAAADLIDAIDEWPEAWPEQCRSGLWDEGLVVQAFAKHRLASLRDVERAGEGDALAKVDAWIAIYGNPDMDCRTNRAVVSALTELRSAIAALRQPPSGREDVAILREALKEARAALHQHYVDWDGEPEDAVPLQLARSKCDAALAKADAILSSDWRGIESAPKDGSKFLGWVNGPFKPGAIRCWWDTDQYARTPRPFFTTDDERIAGKTGRRAHQPTHWMPLPPAPGAKL